MGILSKPHIALLASPGFGHLIPILELAKRLAAQHGVTITVFVVTPEPHRVQDELLRSATSLWPGLINTINLPCTKIEFSSNNAASIFEMNRSVFPDLRSLISAMTNKPVALIVDQFATEGIEAVAREFNMYKYVFIASNAWFLSYNVYLPYVNKKEVSRDDPLHIPGCEPIPGKDILDSFFIPEGQTYKEFLRTALEIATVDGILLNTWKDLEAKTLFAFKDERFMKHIIRAQVYPIGPLVRTGESTGSKSGIFKWLDRQPNESVVFVSFGSGGYISAQQTIELAWGLELSKQRFIWVVRPPIEHKGTDEVISKYLPDGFLDRTSNVGIVVPMWAPQEEILNNGSVGAFLSHCGWNSSLESILNGVPIIAWPLYAEQTMNATMLVKDLGIAVRPDVNPNKELVKRDEIAKLARRVMVDKEGMCIRTRVNQLKASAYDALSEGGTSYIALSEVVTKM